jgi:hypothetical protein
LVNRQITLFL